MSHYAVLVILPHEPTDEAIAAALQPFHEYECTGIDDQYVIDVDVTNEVTETFAKYTYARWVDANGDRHDPYDDRFYRDPAPADGLDTRSPHGTGGNGRISWHSKNWGDGKGYRTKVHMTAEEVGMTEIEVPAAEVEDIAAWAEDYGGWKARPDGTFYKHTNPNAKWDWYQLGGRYSGRLRSLSGTATTKGRPGVLGSQTDPSGVDIVRRDDLDFTTMRLARIGQRQTWINDIRRNCGLWTEDLERALLLRPTINNAWQEHPDPKPRGREYGDWIEATFGTPGKHYRAVLDDQFDPPDLAPAHDHRRLGQCRPGLLLLGRRQGRPVDREGCNGLVGHLDRRHGPDRVGDQGLRSRREPARRPLACRGRLPHLGSLALAAQQRTASTSSLPRCQHPRRHRRQHAPPAHRRRAQGHEQMTEPPFKLIDNDAPSHMWIMGVTLREKCRMPATAYWLQAYAEQYKALCVATDEWRDARRAFLALPPNDPAAPAALNRLAEAEDALYNLKGTAR